MSLLFSLTYVYVRASEERVAVTNSELNKALCLHLCMLVTNASITNVTPSPCTIFHLYCQICLFPLLLPRINHVLTWIYLFSDVSALL